MSEYLLYTKKYNGDNYFGIPSLFGIDIFQYQVHLPGWQMLSKGMQIQENKKSLLKILIFYNLLYYFFWKWKRKLFEMHLLYAKNNIVHYCFVLPKCFRIPLMKNPDLEIGPYYTHPDYRGRGITSYMVGKLIQNHPTSDIYVVVRSENKPSIKVLEKNSLSIVGACNRKKLLGILPKFVILTN